jgi:Carboxypeptidase regulatory-like domain
MFRTIVGSVRVCVALALACAAPVLAQSSAGQISGTVTDPSKARLPGVTVTVTNDDTQAARTAVTDGEGAWVITNLPPARYSVEAEIEGFKKARRAGFVLYADGRLTADLTARDRRRHGGGPGRERRG